MKISLIAERVLRATRRYSFAELAARLWRLTVRSVSPKKHLVYLYEAPPENALLPCDDIVLLDVTSRSEEAEVYRRQMEEEEGVYHTRDLLNWALTGESVLPYGRRASYWPCGDNTRRVCGDMVQRTQAI